MSRMEYTREVGKSRFDNSAAKSLIYDIQEVAPDRGQYGKQYRTMTPFATCEEDEEKYPHTFIPRKKGREGSDKVGGRNKDFDPEIYRQQIRDNNTGKVESQRRAYIGAGNILKHHSVTHMPPPKAYHNLEASVAACMSSPAPPSVAGSGAIDMSSEAGAPLNDDDAARYAAYAASQQQ